MNGSQAATLTMAAVAVLTISLSLARCDRQETEPIHLPQRVAVVKARLDTLQPIIETFGTVSPMEKADVVPQIEGTVRSLFVDVGDRVAEDELLARLDSQQLTMRRKQMEAELEARKAEAQLAQSRLLDAKRLVATRLIQIDKTRQAIELRRAEEAHHQLQYLKKRRLFEVGGIAEEQLELVRMGWVGSQFAVEQAEGDLAINLVGFRDEDLIASGYRLPPNQQERDALLVELNIATEQSELDRAQSAIAVAEAQLAQIEHLLTQMEIRSPIDGVVGTRQIWRGEIVSTERAAFTILGVDSLYVDAKIGEQQIGSVGIGDRAEIELESLATPTSGRVGLIEPYVDARSGSVALRVSIDDPPDGLIPGMFSRVEIAIGDAQTALTIPQSAVMTDRTGDSTAFVVRGDTLFRVPVEIGIAVDGKTALLSGVSAGDLIVREPGPDLREGMTVRAEL